MHVLACFGGAGGQHACAIARSLGMGTVFVHKYAGILSAYGMALADVVEEAQEPSIEAYAIGSSKNSLKNMTFSDIIDYVTLKKFGTEGASKNVRQKIVLHYFYYKKKFMFTKEKNFIHEESLKLALFLQQIKM